MNNSSQLVWSWDGEPFGATPANENVSPTTTFTYNLRFPGQYYDKESGLHQNRWREYDPKQGKYLQSDPLGLAAGVNTYAYVVSSPLMLSDSTGLKCDSRGCWETAEERQLRLNGDVFGYYSLACKNGDSYACNAGRIAKNEWSNNISTSINLLTWLTNTRLRLSMGANILRNSPNLSQPSMESKIVSQLNQVRQGLMQGYGKHLSEVSCEENPVWPSRKYITELHYKVFAENGADPDIFGGSTVDNNWLYVTKPIIENWIGYYWCPNCSK